MKTYSDMISKNDEGFFYKSIACALGLSTSIVYKQIGYWCKINSHNSQLAETHFIDGKWWMYSSYPKWVKRDFPFWSTRTVQRHLTTLEELQLVHVGCYNTWDGDKTKWYSPNSEMFDEFMAQWEDAGSPIRNGGSKQTPEYETFIDSWFNYIANMQENDELDDDTHSDTLDTPSGHIVYPHSANVSRPIQETNKKTKEKDKSTRSVDVSLERPINETTTTIADETGQKLPKNVVANKKGLTSYEQAQREAKSRKKRTSAIRRTDKALAQDRGNVSTKVNVNDPAMPDVGVWVLKLQNQVALESNGKAKDYLTRNQINDLQRNQYYESTEVRSFETLYNSVPDVIQRWVDLRLKQFLINKAKEGATLNTVGAIINKLTKYDTNSVGFAAFISGTGDVPIGYLKLDGITIAANAPQSDSAAPVKDEYKGWMASLPIAFEEAIIYNGISALDEFEEVRRWILEVDGYDIYDYFDFNEERPERFKLPENSTS